MSHYHPSVTIGIPAHNEEKSLPVFLDSLISQDISSFLLEKVVIACDGCTDRTSAVAAAYKKHIPGLKVINDGRRLGQIGRLNQMFSACKSDIFVTFDADTILGHKRVLSQMVAPFRNLRVGAVSGGDTPYSPSTPVERLAAAKIRLWFHTRKNINGGDSVHNLHGCAFALRGEMCRSLHIPPRVIANDAYVYFTIKKHGFNLRFVPEAVVYYRLPSGLMDFLAQTARWQNTSGRISEHFGPWINPYRVVPLKAKISGIVHMLWDNPVLLPAAVLFHFISRFAKKYFPLPDSVWTPLSSTKNTHV